MKRESISVADAVRVARNAVKYQSSAHRD
jgi:hypothetical protein